MFYINTKKKIDKIVRNLKTSLLGDIDVLGTVRFVRRGNLGR